MSLARPLACRSSDADEQTTEQAHSSHDADSSRDTQSADSAVPSSGSGSTTVSDRADSETGQAPKSSSGLTPQDRARLRKELDRLQVQKEVSGRSRTPGIMALFRVRLLASDAFHTSLCAALYRAP